jgi:hypothetical protein
MSNNAIEPAFPIIHADGQGLQYWGLSKRELFAAMAMQGILSAQTNGNGIADTQIAEWSVQNADVLLAELAK